MENRVFCLTVDVEPDADKEGNFGNPLTFKGIEEGVHRLKNLVGDLPVTFFVSGRCLDLVPKIQELFGTLVVEYGVLFNVGDYDPKKERIEGFQYTKKSFDLSFDMLKKYLQNCLLQWEQLRLIPKSIRFGGAMVDMNVLVALGDSAVPFTHSSSTVPGMLSMDRVIDHRLYKHEPYKIGNLIEVPMTIYGESNAGWVCPTPGFGLTDNVMEIIRKAPLVVCNLSLRDFVFGASVFLKDKDDEIFVVDHLEVWIWFAKKYGLVFKTVSEIESLSQEF